MRIPPYRLRALAFVSGLAICGYSGWAHADPPSRVARLGYLSGAVSFSPAGENDWDRASINRPLTPGDRLWTDAGARAEIQVGGAMIRLNADTGVSVLNLDDRIAQLQLTQGTLNVRVRRLERDQVFEVDTPHLAFTLNQPGEYRIEVDASGNATTIVMRSGRGEAFGDGASYAIDARQPYRFTGTGLADVQRFNAPRPDDFDGWASARDRAYDNSGSARYVSPDVVGYQDLDANGSWRVDASHGNVWFPHRMAAGWAPYRDGHWAWVDPWGWTWVDDAPWGFAVSHYGRWANISGSWGWVPGPVRTRAYYAPALVVFVGGNNFQLSISSGNVGGVAWFPLGPREVYRPAYPVSRGYFENVNVSNTVVNNTVINNTYNNVNVTNIIYANRQVPGAVVAVPATAFVRSQPVARAAVPVAREVMASGPVTIAAPVAPTVTSVRGAAPQGAKPPQRVFERPVVARAAPPAAHVGFAAQQPQLAAKPGHPLGEDERKTLKPAAATPMPLVRVAAPAKDAPASPPPPPAAPPTPPATALPPAPVAPGARPPPEPRGKPEERKPREAPVAPAAPRAPDAAPPRVAPAPVVPAPQPPVQRTRPEPVEAPGQGQARPPGAAPKPPPQPAPPPKPPPQPQPAQPPPEAQRGAKEPKPAASQPQGKKGQNDESPRDEDKRKRNQ